MGVFVLLPVGGLLDFGDPDLEVRPLTFLTLGTDGEAALFSFTTPRSGESESS